MTKEEKAKYGIGENQAGRYGCVRCQIHHYSDEAIFVEHVYLQDKHSIQTLSEETLLRIRELEINPERALAPMRKPQPKDVRCGGWSI